MADLRAAIAASVALLALAGCTSGTPKAPEPGERTTTASAPAVRTDAAPVTKRFPSLGTPTELHWLGAGAGADTGGAPGPTDVRVQLLAVLTPEVVAAAEKAYDWNAAPAGWEEEIPEELRPHAPKEADWQASDDFTKEVTTNRYSGTVYLDPVSRTVYLDVDGG